MPNAYGVKTDATSQPRINLNDLIMFARACCRSASSCQLVVRLGWDQAVQARQTSALPWTPARHWFTPVLNPPQTGLQGVGAMRQSEGAAPRLIPLSLTFDHRAIDGA